MRFLGETSAFKPVWDVMRFPHEVSCLFSPDAMSWCAYMLFCCQIFFLMVHYIKSIRMFEDDATWPEYALVIQGGSLRGWVGGVKFEECLPSLGCQYFDQGSFAFFSCPSTVNVIGLLFLQQCLSLLTLVHHRFVAIPGTGVQHQISLRLCQLTFAHALLGPIVHRTHWRRQLLWRAL